MSAREGSDYDALRSVAARYAAGVDRRDRALFLSVFAEDAVMVVPSGDGTSMQLHGHHEIGDVVKLISRFPRTFHLVGQSSYELGGTLSNGEVYCVAHHVTADADADLVMYVRYQDAYRRDGAGLWLIARRHVQVDWTETRPLTWPPKKETQP
ncbi:hypothetical protein BH09ACT8_BH09ACT8_59460 [soil metagenome]